MKRALKVLGILAGSFVALIILLVVVAIAFGDDTTETASTPQTPASNEVEASETQEEVVQEEVKPVGIGEQLQVGDVVFTVNGRSKATNVGGEYGVSSKGEFLILDVSVENKGNEALTVDSSFFKLLADGKTYEADSSAGIYANDNANFFFEEINPDITLQGNVVFDISSEMHNKVLTLQAQTGMFGTETGTIALQ